MMEPCSQPGVLVYNKLLVTFFWGRGEEERDIVKRVEREGGEGGSFSLPFSLSSLA